MSRDDKAPKQKKQKLRRIVQEEERNYRSFFDHATVGFFRATAAGRFTQVNPCLVAMLGYDSAEEALALNMHRDLAIDSTQRQELNVHFAETETTGRELHWKKKDGALVFVSLHVRAVRDKHHRLMAYEGTVIDLTSRQQAEKDQKTDVAFAISLAQERGELRTQLDAPTLLARLCQLAVEEGGCQTSHAFLWELQEAGYTPIAQWGDTPPQWEIIRTLKIPSQAVTRPTPQPLGEDTVFVSTTTVSDLFHHDAFPLGRTTHLWLTLQRGTKGIGALSLEYWGSTREFSSAQARLARGLGALAAIVLENVQLLQELRHANRLKSDFLATISHELRTPLNIILGYSDYLLEGDCGFLTVEQYKVLQAMDRSARELLELIIALLEASQLVTIRPPVEHKEVPLAGLIAELQQEAKRLSSSPGLSFTWRIEPTLSHLYTDRTKLMIILKNLLSNAVKFTPEGNITVAVFSAHEGVEFLVSDTGVGIAPEVRPVIFDLFRQGDSSATRRYGGTGLGLYTVQRMLEILGGAITVESETGRGSTFRVWLPLSQHTTAAGTDAP